MGEARSPVVVAADEKHVETAVGAVDAEDRDVAAGTEGLVGERGR